MKSFLAVIAPGLWMLPATLVAFSLAIHVFPRWNLLDFPERYGLTRERLPYPTGIVAVMAFLCAFLFFEPLSMQAIGVIASLIILAVVSFIDDRTPLPFWLRIVFQVLLCILLFATGSRIYTITNPADFLGIDIIKLDTFGITVPFFGVLPIISGLFTVVWLGLTLNALNWFDGIPGQVSSLSVIGFVMMGLLALSDRVNQPELAMLAFILAGIALACLVFDFPPPKMLLGDSGSMFFGLMLGLLGIYQGGKVATAFLVLGIPLIDAVFVVIRRLMKGSSPVKGDRDHLHHRLLQKGWSERGVILLTGSIGTIFGTTALFLSTQGKGVAFVVLLGLMVGLTIYSGKARNPKYEIRNEEV